MKRSAIFLLCLLAACGKPPPPAPQVFQQDQAAESLPPVQTVPFETGYKAGLADGSADAQPKAKMPEAETVAAKATEAAAGNPDRNEKWMRGYIEGYTDAFRTIALKKK